MVVQFAKSLTTKATKVHEGLGPGWVGGRTRYRRQTLAEMVVVQFTKSITTKATKVHEGNI